jgi:glycosyltransferase involved in cell wall biosynthesis
VLVNYDSVRRILLEQYGPGVPIRKLPYTSEAAFSEPPRARAPVPREVAALTPAGAPLIVAVSRQDPRKGVDVLLRSLAASRATGARFRACLVGGGLLLEAHRRLLRDLGLEGSVTLTGWVPDPAPYLQHADVFVLPSLQEASGSLSMLEAMQRQVAIVASRVDGIPEDVIDGQSGLLASPGDVPALTAALSTLLEDAELRARLAVGGREVFEQRFSAATFMTSLGEMYAELGFPPPAAT